MSRQTAWLRQRASRCGAWPAAGTPSQVSPAHDGECGACNAARAIERARRIGLVDYQCRAPGTVRQLAGMSSTVSRQRRRVAGRADSHPTSRTPPPRVRGRHVGPLQQLSEAIVARDDLDPRQLAFGWSSIVAVCDPARVDTNRSPSSTGLLASGREPWQASIQGTLHVPLRAMSRRDPDGRPSFDSQYDLGRHRRSDPAGAPRR